jgi:hypothetical protein
MVRRCLIAVLGAAACTGTGSTSGTVVRPEAAVMVEAAPREAGPVLVADRKAWVWYHSAPAWMAETTMFGVGVLDRAKLGEVPVTATRTPAGVVVRCGSQWQRTIAGEGELPVVLATRDDGVFVGMRTAAGARVVAFNNGGEQRFDVGLAAPGATEVQLEGCGPRVCVHVRGSRGDRFELERADGRVAATGGVDGGLLMRDAKWPEGALETRTLGAVWPFGGRSYAAIEEKERVVIERRDGSTVGWRSALPEVRPFEDRALVIEAGGLVVVVFHSPIASGVTLWAVEQASGEIRWRSDPPGLGSVKHSEYSNRVAIDARSPGFLIIYGEEAAGRYVAVVDPVDGSVVSDEIWRD